MRNPRIQTLVALTLVFLALPLCAQTPPPPAAQPDSSATPFGTPATTDIDETASLDRHALIALPLATALGAALALRPRRRGTPKRSSPVIQTQIILAIIGALVMIVVGTSLARAFGVVGAAGLVRYRAKIEDPKDAGVMLSTLAVGLACGIGVYGLAIFAALFIVAVLWVIESFEPNPRNVFTLEVKTKESAKLHPKVETLLRRRRVKYELRESKPDEFSYHVELPMELKTDALSAEIIALAEDKETGVEWKTEKKTK
jgi:hypothetical protein